MSIEYLGAFINLRPRRCRYKSSPAFRRSSLYPYFQQPCVRSHAVTGACPHKSPLSYARIRPYPLPYSNPYRRSTSRIPVCHGQ